MIYWIWLQQALGYGNNRLSDVMEKFPSAKAVFSAGEEGRMAAGIFNERELRVMSSTPLQKAKDIYERCIRENITVITPDNIGRAHV